MKRVKPECAPVSLNGSRAREREQTHVLPGITPKWREREIMFVKKNTYDGQTVRTESTYLCRT